jgi:hypothetical protein
MAKTFTVTDITNDLPITIIQSKEVGEELQIRFVQPYKFKDAAGNILESLGARNNVVEIPFASLPTNIQNTLVTIRNYLYNKALETEGML